MKSVTRQPSGIGAGRLAMLALCFFGNAATPAAAQIQISGQVEATALNRTDTRGLNRNFRNDSPFSSIRARLLAQHWVTDNVGVFAEFLYDIEANSPRLNGAYIVINEVLGYEWLGLRAGMAPSLIGNFALRSTYFNINPLIGVPLVYQHRTTLDGSGLATGADLLRRRAINAIGLPMMYDACWNPVAELLGNVARFEYSLGVTNGSLSNPLQTRMVDGVQVLARLGYAPTDALRLGVSGLIGPWIGGPTFDPNVTATSFPGEPDDYDQRLAGFDAEWLLEQLHFFAEGYVADWHSPLIAERLSMRGGYVEGRYDFLPAWFAALRLGAVQFGEIEVNTANGVVRDEWDDDVLRVESSLTYRIAREVQLRADWQHSHFLAGDEEPVDLLAIQLRAVF